jgi:hypothetical protein
VQVSSERIVIFKLVEGREKAVQTLGYSDLLTAQPVSVQVHFLQCCGSGSGIRCLFFLPRDPESGMGKKSGSGSEMNNPDHISESLETIFGIKILKFFDADPGFGINIPDPQHCFSHLPYIAFKFFTM